MPIDSAFPVIRLPRSEPNQPKNSDIPGLQHGQKAEYVEDADRQPAEDRDVAISSTFEGRKLGFEFGFDRKTSAAQALDKSLEKPDGNDDDKG